MFKFTYPNTPQLVGTLLQLKKDYRVTNEEIAHAAEVSSTTVSKWLNFKSKEIRKDTKEKLEDFIAETWQPGLICVTSFDDYPHNLFFNVGSVHDPFYTWIISDEQEDEDIERILSDCEKAIADKRAKKYIVKYYKDMDEANTLGREDERLYSIGAMTGGRTDIKVTFVKRNGVVVKNSLVFTPPKNAQT